MCKKGLPAVWTKEKIEEAFAGFVEKNRRLPVAREMKPQYGLPTRRTFERYLTGHDCASALEARNRLVR